MALRPIRVLAVAFDAALAGALRLLLMDDAGRFQLEFAPGPAEAETLLAQNPDLVLMRWPLREPDGRLPAFDSPDGPIPWIALVENEEQSHFHSALDAGARHALPAGRIGPRNLPGLLEQTFKEREQERKLRETVRALRDSESFLDSIVESIPDIIYRLDGEGRITFINQAIESYGYRVEELIGRSVFDIIHPDDHEAALHRVNERRTGDRRTVTLEIRIWNRRHDEVPFEVRDSVVPTDPFFHVEARGLYIGDEVRAGNFLGTQGVARDVTHRKFAEDLLKAQSKLGAALNAESDLNAALLLCLETAMRLTGMDAGGVYLFSGGKGGLELVVQKGIPDELQPFLSHLASDSPHAVFIRAGQPVYTSYVEFMKRLGVVRDAVYLRAVAVVPLKNENEIIACLALGSRFRDDFPDAARAALDSLILQMGSAIVRIKAETEYRKIESRYRIVVENANEGVFVARKGYIRYANPKMCEITGFASEELCSRPILEIIPPSDRPLLVERDQQRLRGGLPVSDYEVRYLHKDGSVGWAEIRVAEISWENHPATLNLAADITDRKRAEAAGRESERRLADIIEFLPDATLVIDMRGVVLAWNKAMEELTGVLSEEMVGKGDHEYALPFYGVRRPILIDLVLRPDIEMYKHYHFIGMDNETLVSETFVPGLRESGAYLWATARTLRDAEGNAVGAIETLRDITVRKRSEEELEFQAAVLDQISDRICVTDLEGRIVYVNAADAATAGFAKNLMVGETVDIYGGSPKTKQARREIFKRVIESGHWEGEVGAKRGGAEFAYQGRGWVVRDRTDKATGACIILTDITARKKAVLEKTRLEDELRQSQKMEAVGRLAGGVAHDFNNLLTGIKGFAELIVGAVKEKDPIRADAEEIRKAAERAASLTSQLLAFSRKQIIEPKVVNLNELIQESQRMFGRIIGEDIQLVFRPGPLLRNVRIDPNQFDQVLVNLAANARDAMPRGGRLSIETANKTVDEEFCREYPFVAPGEYVSVILSDTGPGLDEEAMSHLFEPFFTTKTMGRGTGLGLATVYGVIKQNNGAIIVRSEHGKGAVFNILLPRVDETATETKAVKSSLARGTETILLVEDEEMVRSLACKVLTANGYKVLEASGGGEALTMSWRYEGKIDLLLTDVVMPVINGRETWEELHARRPEAKVLFMSGYHEDVIAQRGVIEEGTPFLPKPFTIERLLEKVREVLDG